MKRFALLLFAVAAFAQPPAGAPKPVRTGKEAAPVDLTGYWVSPVMEDYRWRMVTPLKGDFASIPVNAEARKVGEAWDPAKDQASGDACKAYGAPGLLRIPGRLHITWRDENTLKIEADQGEQIRLLYFNAKPLPTLEPSIQGFSEARWEPAVRGAAADPANSIIFAQRVGTQGRSLEVTTTKLKAGYLRRNGVPYSANTVLEEYFDVHKEPNGDEWFTVTTIVNDPTYLNLPFITSTDFKREPDGSKFSPSPCSAR
jgi:hypothetical protein